MNAGKAVLLLPLLFSSAAWCDERVDHIRAETMARNQVPLADAQQFILLVKEHGFQ
jgi:hypothetical protein